MEAVEQSLGEVFVKVHSRQLRGQASDGLLDQMGSANHKIRLLPPLIENTHDSWPHGLNHLNQHLLVLRILDAVDHSSYEALSFDKIDFLDLLDVLN